MSDPRRRAIRLSPVVGLALCCAGCASDDSAVLYGQIARSVIGSVQSIPGVNVPAMAPAVQAGHSALDAWSAHVLARNPATSYQRMTAEAQASQYYRQLSPAERSAAGRTLAVDVPPAPGAAGKRMMVYDTQTGRTTGTIYAVKGVPARGTSMVIDSARATYIGPGSVLDTYY
jgi:hypothetical protein